MLGIGIVGLPNVGKSTLFNAITKTIKAEAANYPFCTIEPNIGIVSVPDNRLLELEKIIDPKKTVPTAIEFIDIAGLVKGASKGEGLGNQFLSNIRQTSAICQVVRCFEDDNITHVDGDVDPIRDIDTINTELIFSDLQVVERALFKNQKLIKTNDKNVIILMKLLEKIKNHLEDFKLIKNLDLTKEEFEVVKNYQFLTQKPTIYVANVAEENINEYQKDTIITKLKNYVESINSNLLIISAKVESELAELSQEEQIEFLLDLKIKESGLDKLIKEGYKLLNLVTFFTAGKQEVRAWTIKKETIAVNAAAKIHTDIQKGFIRAEVCSYDNFIEQKGWSGAKENGLMKLEGKEYIVKDGDVMYFRFNV